MTTAIIQTHSGRMIDLVNPDPYALTINDIAHALAHQCRFNGHCKVYYSVANHSLLAALNVPAADALVALMHDAAEAYCGDVVKPLKDLLPAYQDIEAGLWEALAWRYRLPEVLPASVKEIDLRLLATEQRDIMDVAVKWDCIPAGVVPLRTRITPLSIAASRSAFLKHFHKLYKDKRNA